jgi:hypothetical protein
VQDKRQAREARYRRCRYFQRYGDTPISFSEAGEHLVRLMEEPGPPRETSPAYLFHHLTSDAGSCYLTFYRRMIHFIHA